MPRSHPLSVLALLLLAALLQPAMADTRPFAWQISDAKNTIYLLGSVHVGSSQFYPFAPAVEKAFADSSSLVIEADPRDQQGAAEVLARGFYPVGDSLGKHLPQALLDRLGKQLPRYGLTLEVAQGMKPFMILTLIEMGEAARAGYSPEQGVDLHFLQRATERGMKIMQLESISQQATLMDSFTDDESQVMLDRAVSDLENGKMQGDLERTIAAWRAGDATQLERIVLSSMGGSPKVHTAIMEKLNYARNGNMALKVEDYLRRGETCFVVVGAMHVVGERGLLNLLRKKGYSVKQL